MTQHENGIYKITSPCNQKYPGEKHTMWVSAKEKTPIRNQGECLHSITHDKQEYG